MSHSFYIHNVNNLAFQNTLDSLGISNLQLTEDSPKPENNIWPRGDAYLYIDQESVRPVETSYNGDTFQARIFANSSPEDYELAIKLVSEIAKQYNATIEPEDNDALNVTGFLQQYDAHWIKDHATSMLRMLVAGFQNEGGTYTLSGTVRSLRAGPRFFGQLLADPNNAVREFHDRFRTLNYLENHAYIASGIGLKNESGDMEVTISVYGPDVDTVLSDGVDAINLRTEGPENYCVALDQLAEALGEKAIWLSENILLAKAVQESEWNKLIDAIKPVAKTDVFEFGKPCEEKSASESEGYKAIFSSDEWQSLMYSPIVTFAIVAAADGSIDKKEVVSFQQQLIKGLVVDNSMLQQLMTEIIPNLDSLIRDVLEGSVDPKAILEDVTLAVDSKLSSDDAMSYKLSLMQIGKAIAESSGGLLGLFGSKISKEETQALAALSVILKIAPLH
jgi:hypothetical protein